MINSIFNQLIEVALRLDNFYYKREVVSETIQFQQVWASTALGFGGVGGSSLTSATTTIVIKHDGSADVWFGQRLAYSVPMMNDKFKEDITRRAMKSVSKKDVYYEENN